MLKIIERNAKMLALLWLLFITVLFFLPGSALPKANWLSKIFFDKWVHFGFFAVLLYLWRYFLSEKVIDTLLLLAVALLYGLTIEAIQHFFIRNRSFDLGDVLADMAGAIAGLWFWVRLYKKIDPCRNRGRNQN
ncbi:MAG TPA: VanZ family protein [Flavisolibacter sp.]|nr:VanZ family protein [Flavisolibacter sp.]